MYWSTPSLYITPNTCFLCCSASASAVSPLYSTPLKTLLNTSVCGKLLPLWNPLNTISFLSLTKSLLNRFALLKAEKSLETFSIFLKLCFSWLYSSIAELRFWFISLNSSLKKFSYEYDKSS